MRPFWVLFLLIILIIITGAIAAFWGIYDVSAYHKEGMMQGWMLSRVMESSVKSHAKGIKVPALGDSSQLAMGFDHYNEMCVGCHGAPGIPKSEIGQGLNPQAPELPKVTSEWKDAEEKIIKGLGKDVHVFEELNCEEHDNPAKFRNEQEFYHAGDEISI